MHSLLKVALRSSSDSGQRAHGVPRVHTFFPCKYWMAPRRLKREVHTPFSARPLMWQSVQTRKLPGTRGVLANPGREARASLSQQICCQNSHKLNCPSLHCFPPKPPLPLPSRSHTAICPSHLCFIPVASNWTRRQVRQPEAAQGTSKPVFKG